MELTAYQQKLLNGNPNRSNKRLWCETALTLTLAAGLYCTLSTALDNLHKFAYLSYIVLLSGFTIIMSLLTMVIVLVANTIKTSSPWTDTSGLQKIVIDLLLKSNVMRANNLTFAKCFNLIGDFALLLSFVFTGHLFLGIVHGLALATQFKLLMTIQNTFLEVLPFIPEPGNEDLDELADRLYNS